MIQRYTSLSGFLKYSDVMSGATGVSQSRFRFRFRFRFSEDYLRLGLSGLLVLIVFVSGGGRFITHPSELACSECEAVKSQYDKVSHELDFIITQPLKP